MYARRQAGMSPLAIVLPHPNLPRRRSSLLSAGSCSSPHTPRSCGSPSCSSLFFSSNNRNSTDSWNSSNQDVGDMESEWKPEQVLLLQRTLDALPAHLVTPFHGQIPPPNLLEKIARGVADAKGKDDWPHSIRATRAKLVEVARIRAAEASSRKYINDENDEFGCLPEEDEDGNGLRNNSKRPAGIKRPLYRQSSMDFISPSATSLKDTDSMERLGNLIQRTDRVITNPSYHPYSRQPHTRSQKAQRRSSSPPRPVNVPSLISPSTPSSSTLNSLSSLSAIGATRPRALRRSASTLSSMTTSDSLMSSNRNSTISSAGSSIAIDKTPYHPLLPSAMSVAPDPRVARVRRSESFCGPSTSPQPFMSSSPPPIRQSLKRAPSFGTVAQEAKARAECLGEPTAASSDEEEKIRNKKAKKARVKNGSPPPTPSLKALPSLPAKKKSHNVNSKPLSPSKTEDMASLGKGAPKLRMNLQRNPSMFGEELPHLHVPASPTLLPQEKKVKTLRRVKRLTPPSRKIDFGSLLDGTDGDVDGEGEGEERTLGSAFQLK